MPIAFHEGRVPIFKAGYDAHYLGVVDLHLEWVERRGEKSLSVLPEWRLVTNVGGREPDPGVQAIVDRYDARLDEELGVVIGRTEVELDTRRASVRTMESNFGSLVAEAMRQGVGSDVGLTNGGGIRGDRTYAAGTELTRKDILTELPFGNTVVLMELSGADLLAALENGVSRVEDVAGRFPQIAGMALVYDPKAPAGSRVVDIEVGGVPLDPEKVYTVATNDYMAGRRRRLRFPREGAAVDRRLRGHPHGHHGNGARRGEGRGGARGGRPHPHPVAPPDARPRSGGLRRCVFSVPRGTRLRGGRPGIIRAAPFRANGVRFAAPGLSGCPPCTGRSGHPDRERLRILD